MKLICMFSSEIRRDSLSSLLNKLKRAHEIKAHDCSVVQMLLSTYLMFFWSILRHSGVTTAATWKGWRVSSRWQSLPRWNLVKISLSQGVGNQHCCLFCPLFELCHWEVRIKVGGDKQAGQEWVSKSTKFVSAKFFSAFFTWLCGKV